MPAKRDPPTTTPARSGRKPFIDGTIDIKIVLSFVFGVIFLSAMLVLATRFPNPTALQTKVFMTVLSLSAAGVGGILPGFIEVKYKKVLQAGGALALFVVVWFSQPAIERNVVELEWPKQQPEQAVNGFLAELDRGDVASTYGRLDPGRREQVTPGMWKELYDANVQPLGKVVFRRLMSVNGSKAPSDMPIGIYVLRNYATKYVGTPGCRAENVVAKATQDGGWNIYGYTVSPNNLPCPTGM